MRARVSVWVCEKELVPVQTPGAKIYTRQKKGSVSPLYLKKKSKNNFKLKSVKAYKWSHRYSDGTFLVILKAQR